MLRTKTLVPVIFFTVALSVPTFFLIRDAVSFARALNSAGVKCVVYDRPMRTGSSTISSHLIQCFHSLGYFIDTHQLGNSRARSIPHALEQPSPNKRFAIVRGHIWISEVDIRLLHTRCDQVVYITSCAPLWQQVWSAAKMLSYKRVNGNTTLGAEDAENALKWLQQNAKAYARMYEFYPFIHLTEPLERLQSNRYPDLPPSFERAEISSPFRPDYVIRKDRIIEDLSKLLDALGCDARIGNAKNVHQVQGEDDEAAYEIKIRQISGVGEGETYRKLMEFAKSNDAGLSRIRSVVAN